MVTKYFFSDGFLLNIALNGLKVFVFGQHHIHTGTRKDITGSLSFKPSWIIDRANAFFKEPLVDLDPFCLLFSGVDCFPVQIGQCFFINRLDAKGVRGKSLPNPSKISFLPNDLKGSPKVHVVNPSDLKQLEIV